MCQDRRFQNYFKILLKLFAMFRETTGFFFMEWSFVLQNGIILPFCLTSNFSILVYKYIIFGHDAIHKIYLHYYKNTFRVYLFILMACRRK